MPTCSFQYTAKPLPATHIAQLSLFNARSPPQCKINHFRMIVQNVKGTVLALEREREREREREEYDDNRLKQHL